MPAVTAPRSSPELPADAALPELAGLLGPRPARATAGSLALDDARVRYLEYRPGRWFLVQLQATSAGRPVDVVASRGVVGAGFGVHPYPHDPALPLLTRPGGPAGVLGLPAARTWQRLAWVPHRRAALRSGDVVVKLYGSPADAEVSVRALDAVAGVLPTARLLTADVERGAVAQSAVPGVPLTRADASDAAAAAGALARRLHTAAVPGLPGYGPDALLAACGPVVELVRFACPRLGPRVVAVAAALRDRAPVPVGAVPSHGDYNMGQLLRGDDGGLAVVDTDTLCRAPAALDLACYAANLVSGRPGDLDAALATLDVLVAGYGAEPPGLGWYLAASVLRRLDRPLRRWKRDWPRRTEALLAAAEALAAR